MSGSNGAMRPHTLLVDTLFAQLPGERFLTGGLAPDVPGGTRPSEALMGNRAEQAGAPPLVWPQPPPSGDQAFDVQAAYDWLQMEKKRLEEYTRTQFDLVRQQHQALLFKHLQSEQALATRAQDLNREMQFLAAQSEALQRRAAELAEREQELALHMERLAQANDALLAAPADGTAMPSEGAARRASLQGLCAETARLQAAEASARAELASFETALRERQQAWEERQAELTARQTEMEQRYSALEKAEAAAQRRIAELNDWEERLREEFEENERRLSQERRELELLRVRVHQASALPGGNRSGNGVRV